MRALLRITLIASLLVWCASAQRGGHGGGGGFHGGGMGGGFHGGGMSGGFRGGGGFNGGFSHGGGFGFNRGGGFTGGFNRGGFGFNRGGFGFNRFGFGFNHGGFNRFGFGFGGVWPWGYGWGWGWPGYGVVYSPGYYGYPYYGYSDMSDYSDYSSYPQTYTTYNAAPAAVVYPQAYSNAPAYSYPSPSSETAHPVIRSYDQYGQEVQPSGTNSSPIYLFAMKDGVIRAAASYWVQNGTVHYVTLQHEEKTMPLTSLDRTLTNQLNRERHVNLSLGQ